MQSFFVELLVSVFSESEVSNFLAWPHVERLLLDSCPPSEGLLEFERCAPSKGQCYDLESDVVLDCVVD